MYHVWCMYRKKRIIKQQDKMSKTLHVILLLFLLHIHICVNVHMHRWIQTFFLYIFPYKALCKLSNFSCCSCFLSSNFVLPFYLFKARRFVLSLYREYKETNEASFCTQSFELWYWKSLKNFRSLKKL